MPILPSCWAPRHAALALASPSPYAQRTMCRGQYEIVVGRQERKLVADAELREHGVDRADLQAGPATTISQVRGIDVILPVRGQKRQGGEPVDDVFARPRAGESLQQFLQNQPRGQDSVATFEGIAQRPHLWGRCGLVAAECKRPDTRIDEQAHERERSAL